MSILHHSLNQQMNEPVRCDLNDALYQRDALGDLKHGLDLIFKLKAEFDKFHPLARETLIRMCAY